MVLLAMLPQIHLWIVRGREWQGAYTILQGDELLYSAYVNALIDGRPRRTDPATGRDDHPQAPLPESIFSIQFIPPYAIAWFARVCGISASAAFIAQLVLGAFLGSASVFWLLTAVTHDHRVAAVGTLVVLCLGALAGGQGLVGLVFKPDVRFLGLPFLRRYEPAVPFPFFFLFCTLIWQALTRGTLSAAVLRGILAGMTLAILIFSYFYFWTAAGAWIVCIACLWLIFRPAERRRTAYVLVAFSVPVVPALIFYAVLVLKMPTAVGEAQVLTLTRQLDLLRVPEIIGALILILLVVGIRQRKISINEPRAIIIASFGLLPWLVFNQQIITGRSLQPYHYEVLITNYAALVGLVVIVSLLQTVIRRRTLLLIVVTSLLFAAVEVNLPSPVRSKNDAKRDEMIPVFLRLRELADFDGTWRGLSETGRTPALVFSPQFGVSAMLSTWAPQGLLLAPGSASFQGLSRAERKDWLYAHLYFSGRNEDSVRQLLNRQIDDSPFSFYATATIFGSERALPFLGLGPRPITKAEIENEIRAYQTYANAFSREQALKRPLTYVITEASTNFDFANIDRWYERDSGERVGAYILYRVRLKN